MWEKIAAGFVLFLLSTAMAFFWRNQSAQDERMKRIEGAADDAHDRITKQGERNNDKFARRDDMLAMEARIIESINTGLESLKTDIRAQNNNGGGR